MVGLGYRQLLNRNRLRHPVRSGSGPVGGWLLGIQRGWMTGRRSYDSGRIGVPIRVGFELRLVGGSEHYVRA